MGIFGKSDAKPGETTPRPVSAAPPPAPSPAPARSAAPAPVATTACVIGAKTQFKGELTGTETVLVEGLVEGTVRITGDLRIGRGGR